MQFHQHIVWEMAWLATDSNFMQEVRENLGEFSPFPILFYQKYIDCIHFQASHYKANSLRLQPLLQVLPPSTPQPQKKVKRPQNYYLKSGTSGTFSACKCVQFESPGLFFHLLWYAYLIHCPRLDLIWCTLVQGWWWATSEGPRQRVVFSVLSVGPLFWSTVLPHGFICTWNAESISTYWLWIMTAKKEV